jgi:hypothetical protein
MDCLTAKGATTPAFLWTAYAQSGFKEGLSERNAITSPRFGPSGLTFVGSPGTGFQRFA